jgi:hypothetical protein
LNLNPQEGHMGKSKYSIQKRLEKNKHFYDLIRSGEILYTSSNYEEILNFTKSAHGVEYTDEQIEKNLWSEAGDSIKQVEIEQKYERPGTGVDMFVSLLMILSVVGFLISFVELRLSGFILIAAIVILLTQLVLLGAILTSRKVDRALLDRLDEVEKKLDMYKKGKLNDK